MRLVIRATLADLGFEILEAETAKSALDGVRGARPDWVLTEFQLQPMNGLVLAEKIRDECPATRIIMVTNCEDPELRENALRAGCDGFVLKDDLLAVRKLILANAGADRSKTAC